MTETEYATNLIKKAFGENHQTDPVWDAWKISVIAHHGQLDKAGNPYWLHPLSVMIRLGRNATDDEKCAALLHDVIEDTDYGRAELLKMGVSERTVQIVEGVSRTKEEPRPTYMEWIRSIADTGDASIIKVKIADLKDNSDPVRIAQLPIEQQDIANRYERALKILRPALEKLNEETVD